MNPASKEKVLVALAVIILALGALLWWYLSSTPVTVEDRLSEDSAGFRAEVSREKDLGTEIFEQASNPVSGKLPDTVAPISNPIEGIYKNPFGEI